MNANVPSRCRPQIRPSIGIGNKALSIKTASACKSQFTLYAAINRDDDDNDDENKDENTPMLRKVADLVDPIISAPSFATFLFWLPFFANPTLRYRAYQFISTKIGENSVVPIIAITVMTFVSYLVYQDRLDTIELARGRTADALQRLKDARSSQLSGNNDSNIIMEDYYNTAMEYYQQKLTEELNARYILPGVKVPGVDWDPADREEDKAAARQFLKMEITEEGTLKSL